MPLSVAEAGRVQAPSPGSGLAPSRKAQRSSAASPSGSCQPVHRHEMSLVVLAAVGKIDADWQLGGLLPIVTVAVASRPSPKPSWAVTRTSQASPFFVCAAATVAWVTLAKAPSLNQR